MAKYTTSSCLVVLSLAVVSCDRMKDQFTDSNGGGSVTESNQTSAVSQPQDLVESAASNSDSTNSALAGSRLRRPSDHTTLKPPWPTRQEPEKDDDDHPAHAVPSRTSGMIASLNKPAARPRERKREHTPTALELTLMELAAELRLKEELEPARRAELERELVKLRMARQQLYQRGLEN